MSSAPFHDPAFFDRLAADHRQAWQALASSAATVVALPLWTAQQVLGLAPPPKVDAADERETEAWQRRLDEQAAVVAAVRRDYTRLEAELGERIAQAAEDRTRALYALLEPLLTQLPAVRHAVAEGRAVDTADLLALLGPLDDALAMLGLAPIGSPGEAVPFDAHQHQVTRGSAPEAGAPVAVKHVGYRLGEQILRKARVTAMPPR